MRATEHIRRLGLDVVAIGTTAARLAQLAAGSADGPTGWVLASAAIPLIYLGRRRFPLGAPVAAVWALAAVSLASPEAGTMWAGSGVVIWLSMVLAAWASTRRTLVPAFAATVSGILVSGSANPDVTDPALDVAWTIAIAAAVFAAATALRRYREQAVELRLQTRLLEREREEREHLAAAEERARIARDLHDVVAHSVSVMVVNAGGVRRLLRPDQEREREALAALERTGRDAMEEIRRVLGVLRDPAEPAERRPPPGMAAIETLVADVRSAGLPVELRVEGAPVELPAGVGLSAYRAAQEALTNVLKHAHARRAVLTVRYSPESVEVEVTDDGHGPAPGAPGHGLVGLRERAALLGGELHTGSRPGGGFVLQMRLPTKAAS